MEYFIDVQGRKQGPFTTEELKRMYFIRETLVWREGLKDWIQITELNELNFLSSRILPAEVRRITFDQAKIIFFVHLFFGFGFYYVDKSVKRKILYPVLAFYALIDAILGPGFGIEPFASDQFGLYSCIASLVICYGVGYPDVYIHWYRRNQNNSNRENLLN